MKAAFFSCLLIIPVLTWAQDSAVKKGLFDHTDVIDIAKDVFHYNIHVSRLLCR